MNRAEILKSAENCVTGKREEDYGSPEDNFALIASFWSTYLKTELSAKDVGHMMILLKVARAKTGFSLDNYIDIAGYAACTGEIEEKKIKKSKFEIIVP